MKNPLETLFENNEGKQKLERLHEEVKTLGQMALEWKNRCHAMELALETERQAADRYARQVAHWIAKHDELLEDQLRTVPQEWNDENVIKYCIDRGIKAAKQ